MLSKRKLGPFLASHGFEPDYVNYETYGSQTRAYIHVGNMTQRVRLEKILRSSGHKVYDDYWPNHPTVEVQVSYFHAPGWNE